MKIHDRGSMKWVSLMLPEHVAELREIFTVKKEKPLLDEQQMATIDYTLKKSLHMNEPLRLTYYDAGKLHTVEGALAKIDQQSGYIMLCDEAGGKIPLRDVVAAELISHTLT